MLKSNQLNRKANRLLYITKNDLVNSKKKMKLFNFIKMLLSFCIFTAHFNLDKYSCNLANFIFRSKEHFNCLVKTYKEFKAYIETSIL